MHHPVRQNWCQFPQMFQVCDLHWNIQFTFTSHSVWFSRSVRIRVWESSPCSVRGLVSERERLCNRERYFALAYYSCSLWFAARCSPPTDPFVLWQQEICLSVCTQVYGPMKSVRFYSQVSKLLIFLDLKIPLKKPF